ncbi:MAG: hypothetical protein DSZ12_04755 [Sulfurovum sp.]|nr:MAG: hypothetical protein DSZ08_05075 [Sulfurovum sp.]RUM74866.1 MAG: hypothetical protein DSZ12_04755 [Sulfurovum sp.]
MQINKKFTLYYVLLGVTLTFLLSACGYKPSSQYIKEMFSDTVYVEVEVDRAEPENAPYVKDEMNRLIYTRFKGRVVPKEQAQSQIYVSYQGTTFRALAYTNGYITRYRANVRVRFKMITKRGVLKKNISARVESEIQASSLQSSKLRTEAIRKGLEKALDEFLAYVAAKGTTDTKKSDETVTMQVTDINKTL